MTTRFTTKDPGEVVRWGFNFRAPVANPAIEVLVRSGTDPAPGAMLSGAPFVSGDWVYQLAEGGLDGVEYEIRCLADVGGERLLIDALQPVVRRPTAA